MKNLSKRRLAVLGAIAVMALVTTASFAIATPNSDVSNETVCGVWETPGTDEYQKCLDNLNAQDGLVAGSAAAGAPTISATRAGDSHPPLYVCLAGESKSNYASASPIKHCTKPLVCTNEQGDGKYRCVDETGTQVDPPDGICQKNPTFACSERVSIGILTDEVPSTSATHPPTSAPDSSTSTAQPTPADTRTHALPSTSASPTPTVTIDAGDPVGQALAQARTRGLRVWLESDLVGTWRSGPDKLRAAAATLSRHAAQPGVVGVKIAFDLGLRGEFNSSAEINTFLAETSRTVREALPAGRQLAVDIAVPELGCGSNQRCIGAMRSAYPLLTAAQVEQYVLTGAVDAVNISSGLFLNDYAKFKITPAAAARNLWLQVRLRAWKTRLPGLFLGAREIGLAHAQETDPRTASSAATLIRDRVEAVLSSGADHVVLWTWRQTFDGRTWRLTNAGGRDNALWSALRTRQGLRAISVTYNPAEPEADIPLDIKKIAEVASAVFVFVP